MDLYFIRHASAVELDREISEDSFRYLSPEGRAHSAEIAQKLHKLNINFDLILSSPIVRAIQTAEIFSNIMHHKGDFKTAVELIGGSSFNRFQQLLHRSSNYKSIACFGHSPDMNQYSINLIKENRVKELKVNFKNCSVCRIKYDYEKDKGSFVWFLKSDTLELVHPSKEDKILTGIKNY
jgi:phosphohistidine phosphatase